MSKIFASLDTYREKRGPHFANCKKALENEVMKPVHVQGITVSIVMDHNFSIFMPK
jgi:hypothetical protein